MGYAFEIDEPCAARVLGTNPFMLGGTAYEVMSVCRKDSTEVDEVDRAALLQAVRRARAGSRIVVTHGTDTMIESARAVLTSGAAQGKAVAFTGAMKPERFKDSDASFNLGGAVFATALLPPGAVVVCMGGDAIPADVCVRDTASGRFVRQL